MRGSKHNCNLLKNGRLEGYQKTGMERTLILRNSAIETEFFLENSVSLYVLHFTFYMSRNVKCKKSNAMPQ